MVRGRAIPLIRDWTHQILPFPASLAAMGAGTRQRLCQLEAPTRLWTVSSSHKEAGRSSSERGDYCSLRFWGRSLAGATNLQFHWGQAAEFSARQGCQWHLVGSATWLHTVPGCTAPKTNTAALLGSSVGYPNRHVFFVMEIFRRM